MVDSISFPNLFIEIFLTIDGVAKKILFGSLYFPCNFDYNLIYNGLSAIRILSSQYDGVILGGDLNAKHLSWGDIINNCNGIALFNWLSDYCSDFTRISDNVPSFPNGNSFLDHFLISTNLVDTINPNFTIRSLPTFSDHFPLNVQLKFLNFEFVLRQPRIFTSFKNTNWNSFKNDITLNLTTHFPPSNVNLSNLEIDLFIGEFSSTINQISDRHCEKITQKNRKIFVSDKINNLYKLKYSWQKELRRLFRRTLNRKHHDYILLSKQIQLLKIIIKEQVQIEQAEIFKNRLSKIKPGPQAYKDIYGILGNSKNSTLSKITVNGLEISDNTQKLSLLKDHFSAIYSGSTPNRDLSEIEHTITEFSQIPNFTFEFNDVFLSTNIENNSKLTNANELCSISNSINNKKSSGLDSISNFIIKKFPNSAFDYLAIIFNNCINNGYFPNAWKTAKICPIPKKRNNFELNNVRPISLLSNLGKLFEKVIRIMMDRNLEPSYIPNHQFGFKKYHSTSHALLKFQNDVISNLRIGKCTIAVSLDIEKAFDHAYHDGIIFKMINIGFDPIIIKLVQNFFTNRKFCVQLQNEYSEFSEINCGVPQGSILAPHLYNIFIHDFPHELNGATGILYADDSLIYAHGISPKDTLISVSRYLNTINDFYKLWGIKINISKSQAICLRNASMQEFVLIKLVV